MIPKLCVTPVRAGDKPDTDYVTVEEACEILGLKDSQTRKLLGEPDKVWLSASNQVQYAFEIARVHKIKQERDERLQRHIAEYGMKSCYLCRKKFLKSELVSGICPRLPSKKNRA